MTDYITLLYVCQFGGLLIIVGGIFLIYKQKLHIDKITKQIHVELPRFGRLRTNSPAFAFFVLGFILMITPIFSFKIKYLRVRQDIKSTVHPVLVYAAVTSKSLPRGEGHFDVSIPVLATDDYNPELIYVAGDFIDNESLELRDGKNGFITLHEKTLQIRHEGNNRNFDPADVVPPSGQFK